MGDTADTGATAPNAAPGGAPTIDKTALGEVLTAHKLDRGIGDTRLATIANDRVGIANFVTRSTIRNWAAGSVARASNWRQLAAVASALQLDLEESDELMRAGGCDPISDLLRVARSEDAIHLVYWSVEADTAQSAGPESEEPSDLSEPHEAPEDAPVSDPTFPEVDGIDGVDGSDADGSATELAQQAGTRTPDLGIPASSLVATWLAPLAFIVIGALAAVGLWYLLSSAGSAASSTGARTAVAPSDATDTAATASETENDAPAGAAEATATHGTAATGDLASGDLAPADLAPATTVDVPAPGVTIQRDLVASGTARHPDGIDHVELVIKNLDVDLYWNPVDGVWQEEFVRFTVPTVADLAEVSWSYRLPVPLTAGEYRVRAWARAVNGNGDPTGPLSEFTAVNNTANAITPGAAAAPDGPNQLVIPPADDGYPRSTLDAPAPGETAPGDVIIAGTAEDPGGVAYVELILRRLNPSDEYWNPDTGSWQSEFLRFTVDVDKPGEALVNWRWAPPETLVPGEYRARVWANGSDGGRDEARTLSDFTVADPAESADQ